MRIWLKDPESTIVRIQAGDEELRNDFIRESLPFVRHAVFKVTRDFYAEKSEAFSDALEAFNRSIDCFRPEKQIPFEPFARIIIRNSVLNRIRTEARTRRKTSMTETQNDEGEYVSRIIQGSDGREEQRNLEFEEAMAETESKLQLFGMSLRELASRIPKHADTRRLCIRAARILGEPDLQDQMSGTRKLPVKVLSQRSGIPVKTIEKNRAAIILYEALMSCGPDSIRYYAKAFEEGR